jgi:hypothetical protein
VLKRCHASFPKERGRLTPFLPADSASIDNHAAAAYRDEICKIMKVPRDMLDKAAMMRPDLLKRVAEGAMDFEEAARRSRN